MKINLLLLAILLSYPPVFAQTPDTLNAPTRLYYSDLHTVRSFLGNGYGPPAREGYVMNTMIFSNHFAFGLTDWWSIGAAFTYLPVIVDDFIRGVSSQVSIPLFRRDLRLGGGVFWGYSRGFWDILDQYDWMYANLTIGPRSRYLSLGAALPIGHNNFNNISMSANYGFLISRRWALYGEGYYSLRTTTYAMHTAFGARYLRDFIAFDFGFAAFWNEDGRDHALMVGATAPFKIGKR